MYDTISDVIFNFFNKVISFITTAPVCYLFYMCFVIWAFHLFFRFRSVR